MAYLLLKSINHPESGDMNLDMIKDSTIVFKIKPDMIKVCTIVFKIIQIFSFPYVYNIVILLFIILIKSTKFIYKF